MMLHLAKKVPLIYEDPDEFTRWLDGLAKAGAISYKVDKDGDRVMWSISCRINTGVSNRVDPINNLVLLGFAFFGQFWAFMPDAEEAFKYVKKWWKKNLSRLKH